MGESRKGIASKKFLMSCISRFRSSELQKDSTENKIDWSLIAQTKIWRVQPFAEKKFSNVYEMKYADSPSRFIALDDQKTSSPKNKMIFLVQYNHAFQGYQAFF